MKKQSETPSLVFVVGSPRSGTSYLSRALGLADHTAYLGESGLFSLVSNRSDLSSCSDHMKPKDIFPWSGALARVLGISDCVRRKDRVKDSIEHILKMAKVESYDLAPSDTLYKVKGIELDDSDKAELMTLSKSMKSVLHAKGSAGFADQYFEQYRNLKGCRTVVEKTPEHLRYLPLIHSLFPDAKVVLIRRDKEACLRSYFKTFGRGVGAVRLLPRMLAEQFIHRQLKQDIRRESWAETKPWIKLVEFNTFLDEPVAVIKDIVSWLGLDFDWSENMHLFSDTHN